MKKPEVTLVGENSSANIFARCERVAEHAGWTKAQLDAVLMELVLELRRNGDRADLLRAAMKYFDVR